MPTNVICLPIIISGYSSNVPTVFIIAKIIVIEEILLRWQAKVSFMLISYMRGLTVFNTSFFF